MAVARFAFRPHFDVRPAVPRDRGARYAGIAGAVIFHVVLIIVLLQYAPVERAIARVSPIIVLHGVWSWVPEPVRGEILELIRRRLRPGGLVMVSYNAMPGWAHLSPIRRMMRAHAAEVSGSSLDKARAAYAHVQVRSP